MEESEPSASAPANSTSSYTSMIDGSTLLAAETVGQHGGCLGRIAWLGGVLFVGTAAGALVLWRSSTARSPAPTPVARLQGCLDDPADWKDGLGKGCDHYASGALCTASGGYGPKWDPEWGTFSTYSRDGRDAATACCGCGGGASAAAAPSPAPGPAAAEADLEDGAVLKLKSVFSGFYLHVEAETASDGDPVSQLFSRTEGSEWRVKRVGGSGSLVMLKSERSGYYLHVSTEYTSSGDPVFHTGSTSDGSQWQVESVGSSGRILMLKSIRSGLYLHVSAVADTSVTQDESASEGSEWLME